jgi:SAM-dependent methyltransferase
VSDTPPSSSLVSAFDALAPFRLRSSRRFRLYSRDRVQWLRRILRPDGSVADIGCGVGTTLAALPQTRKTGIDFSPAMIAIARGHDPISTYLVEDMETLQHGESYDSVLLLDSINYFRDIQQCLRNVRDKLCHDESRMIITYYNFLWRPIFLVAEWLGIRTKFPEQNWLAAAEVEGLLALSDFEVIEHGERILLPVYVPLLSAFCNTVLVHLPLLRRLALVRTLIARPVPRRVRNDSLSVTVLSAVRNEKGNIARIVDAMPPMGSHTEILFIEGHSVDGTWEEIGRMERETTRPGITVRGLRQTGTGKANALFEGVAEAQGDLLMIYDGDYTVHPSELGKLYDALAAGRAEFVNASRLVYPQEEGAMRLLNLIGNKFFSLLFTWLFSQRLVDVLSPVKALWRRDCVVRTRLDPFGDFDLFLCAAERHLKIRELPVRYLARSYGTTKIRRFSHGWLLLRLCGKAALSLKFV